MCKLVSAAARNLTQTLAAWRGVASAVRTENGGRRSKSPNMLGRRTNTPTMQSSNSRSNTPINSTSRIPVNRSSSRTPNTTCTPTTGNSRPAMNNSSSRIPVNSSSAKRNPTVVTRSISIQCNMPSLDTDATDTTATRDSPPPSEFEEPVLRQRSGGEKRDRSSMTEFLSTETMLLEVRPGTPSVETDEFLSFEATLSEVDEHNHTTPTETTDPSEDADAALEQAFSEAYICNVVSPSTRAHRQRMQQMRAARMHAEERELYSKDEANCYTVRCSSARSPCSKWRVT